MGVPRKRKKARAEKNYEGEKVRKFQDSWLENPNSKRWLRYDEEKKLMFHRACEAFGPPDQIFVKGCNSNRQDSIQCHLVSKDHIRAYEKQHALEAAPGSTQAERMLEKLNEQSIEKLKHLFRTAHALAMKNRSFTDCLALRAR